MKARELMIGDWIYFQSAPYKVTTLTTFFALSELADNFHPIPLTEEILKKNALHDDCEWWYDSTTRRFMFKVYGYMKAFEGTLKYVHELQHTLRFCGMSEVADNIKIE